MPRPSSTQIHCAARLEKSHITCRAQQGFRVITFWFPLHRYVGLRRFREGRAWAALIDGIEFELRCRGMDGPNRAVVLRHPETLCIT